MRIFAKDTVQLRNGDEIDLAVSQDFAKRYNVLLKGAAYSQGDAGTPTDTTKVWLQLSAKF